MRILETGLPLASTLVRTFLARAFTRGLSARSISGVASSKDSTFSLEYMTESM